MPVAHWFSLSKTPFLARSSHCVSVTKSGILIVYGGELKPRTPIDAGVGRDATPRGSLHVFDLAKGLLSQGWRMLTPDPKHTSDFADQNSALPQPRVGATTVWLNDALYLWGGRGGEDMTPLDAHQVGVWKATINASEGPQQSVRWERIVATNEDQAPESRSYHASVALGGNIYIHAGCPTSGRLSTLHAFHVKDCSWKVLASAPEPGRGGTSLAATTVAGKDLLLRFGGFCGQQLPSAAGEVDIYIIAEDKWVTIQPTADPVHGSPGPRSVAGFAHFQSPFPALSNSVAVLYHGEREASSQGHAGAGQFWDDVWVLLKEGDDVLNGWQWQQLEVYSDDHLPEGRGWFPPAAWVDGHGDTKLVLFGGLLSSNERSDELWELEIN
ncbi:hypothetical protein BD309DRAFT_947861 [Dichomitus squalens]|uniref:Uncharacterized protein n=1 Tax=Dichomitus squalens TaxID=114155 RepID=A0A4V2K5R3_9APHY|nr:hypothetical protein BD311DRAFT_700458 [Dichomitus squalens]TBU49343.1 hypothetical protein BD309DRAFT_947861 [Dichomitus squalens]